MIIICIVLIQLVLEVHGRGQELLEMANARAIGEKDSPSSCDEFKLHSLLSEPKVPYLPDNSHKDSEPNPNIVLLALNEADSDALSSALKSAGNVVLTAENKNSAISKFIENRPNIVVLEYENSNCDGLGIASEILEMRSETRIVMFLSKGGISKEAEDLGVDLFLRKSLSTLICVDSIMAVAKLSPTRYLTHR